MKTRELEPLTKVKVRYLRISPRKVRLAADLIRGKSVAEALTLLEFTPKGSTPVLKKLLGAAMSSLEKTDASPEQVRVMNVMVDGGPTLKRWRPRAMGRASMIRKRTSHITLTLGK